jgi:hypothetical protein
MAMDLASIIDPSESTLDPVSHNQPGSPMGSHARSG